VASTFSFTGIISFLTNWMPTVPDTTPFANTFEKFGDQTYFLYNSFHWGPLQYAALSTTDPTA